MSHQSRAHFIGPRSPLDPGVEPFSRWPDPPELLAWGQAGRGLSLPASSVQRSSPRSARPHPASAARAARPFPALPTPPHPAQLGPARSVQRKFSPTNPFLKAYGGPYKAVSKGIDVVTKTVKEMGFFFNFLEKSPRINVVFKAEADDNLTDSYAGTRTSIIAGERRVELNPVIAYARHKLSHYVGLSGCTAEIEIVVNTAANWHGDDHVKMAIAHELTVHAIPKLPFLSHITSDPKDRTPVTAEDVRLLHDERADHAAIANGTNLFYWALINGMADGKNQKDKDKLIEWYLRDVSRYNRSGDIEEDERAIELNQEWHINHLMGQGNKLNALKRTLHYLWKYKKSTLTVGLLTAYSLWSLATRYWPA